MRLSIIAFIILFLSPLSAQTYPGKTPTKAISTAQDSSHTLENNLIKATWSTANSKFISHSVTNKLTGDTFTSTKELFAIATKAQAQDPDRIYIAFRKNDAELQALISNDAKSWETLASLPLASFPGKLNAIRIGKTSSTGQANDYVTSGEMGTCEFQQVQILSSAGNSNDITSKPTKTHKSKRKDTSLEIANEQITISANANSTAYTEYAAPADWSLISCKVKKGTRCNYGNAPLFI